jgi:lysophospholipase L1-like esterase
MFGDSITQLPYSQGAYSESNAKGIVEFFSDITGAEVVRCAIGGTKISRLSPVTEVTDSNQASDAQQICSMVELSMTGQTDLLIEAANYTNDTDAAKIIRNLASIDMNTVDAITVFGGTNDSTDSRVQLNNKDNEYDTATLRGGLNTIIKSVHENYPHIKIFIFTPIVRYYATGTPQTDADIFNDDCWSDNYVTGIGKHLYDYADEEIAVAKAWHIPVCDLYREMGWDKYNFVRYLFRKAVGTSIDGTHPRFGYDKIAEKMASFIIANW